jgi:hypothetical protein
MSYAVSVFLAVNDFTLLSVSLSTHKSQMAMSQPHPPRAGICTECARSEFIAKLAQDAARLAILDGRTIVTRRDVVTAARFYGIVIRADERHQAIVSQENIEDVPL